MSNPYVPLLWMMGIAGVMALGGVGASAILGPKRYNRARLSPIIALRARPTCGLAFGLMLVCSISTRSAGVGERLP